MISLNPDDLYIMEGFDLNKIIDVMNKLYQERTLTGDTQRDMAHTLLAALDNKITYIED